MALESLVVVPDPHQRYDLIDNAGIVVDMIHGSNEVCRKVVHVGDFYNEFDQKIASELQKEITDNPQFQQLSRQLDFYKNVIEQHVQKEYDGDVEWYYADLRTGNVPKHIMQVQQQAGQLNQQVRQILGQGVVLETVKKQLEGFKAPLEALIARGVDPVAVYGNHDPNFIDKILPLRIIGGPDNDPYLDEGMVGHGVPFPPHGLPDPKMHAPSGLEDGDDDVMYGEVPDEAPDYLKDRIFDDLEEARQHSAWYKRMKGHEEEGKDIRIVVAHNGPRVGLYSKGVINPPAQSGGGLTALASDKAKDGTEGIYLCGHLHGGAIYWWKGQLIVNPGLDYLAEVAQEDGKLKYILLYEADNPSKGAVEVFMPSDIKRARMEREGIVWGRPEKYAA